MEVHNGRMRERERANTKLIATVNFNFSFHIFSPPVAYTVKNIKKKKFGH